MKVTTYLVNDEKLKVRSMQIGSSLWLHVNGEQWVIDLRDAKSSAKGGTKGAGVAAGNESGDLYAPMPGKVLKVYAKVGEAIKAQTPLVVMEAMKMEYNLMAPFDGEVTRLDCTEGQIVELNQLLVKVEKKS